MPANIPMGIALTLFLGLTLPASHEIHASPTVPSVPNEGIVASPVPDTLPTRWVIQAEASEARYRVREQLAGLDFPNDAVGTTKSVSGTIEIAGDGTILADRSAFRVDLTTLATDNDRRDNYVRQRTLEVEEHPEAVLTPRRFVGLPFPLPESGAVRFRLEADLALHGVTAPTVWDVMAQVGPESISGLATTAFTFDTFGIAVPRVARVLSVDDNIRLELEFRLVPGEG